MTPVTGPSTPRDTSAHRTGVVVLDDLEIVREGVRQVLTRAGDLELVAEGALKDGVRDLVRGARAEIVLVDVGGAPRPEAEFVRAVGRHNPATRVVVFSAVEDRELLWEVLEAGARGFVLKDVSGDELLAALRAVAAGRSYVDERMAPDVLRQEPRPRRGGALSDRERQILQMLADGASNNEVSERLVVSVETVKTHVKHILAKLGAKHRTQAVAIGLRQGMIR